MHRTKDIVKTRILSQNSHLTGFSIFKYNNNSFDVYIPTRTIKSFYFFTLENNELFTIDGNISTIGELDNLICHTQEILHRNFQKVIDYSDVYIQEHDNINLQSYSYPEDNRSREAMEQGLYDLDLGEYTNALSSFNDAINQEPYNSDYYIKRASLHMELNQYNRAIDDICRAIISNPNSKQQVLGYYEDLGNVFVIMNDYKSALKYYTISLNNNERPLVLNKRAECYIKIGEYDRAKIDIELSYEINRRIETLLLLGEIYLKMGNLEEAKTKLKQVLNFKSECEEDWAAELNESLNEPFKEKARIILNKL